MTTTAHVIADSLSPLGVRLTTMQLRYPRFIHAQFLTHRMFSRNSASSRAKSVQRMLDEVRIDPVVPQRWGVDQRGMQSEAYLEGQQAHDMTCAWRELLFDVCDRVEALHTRYRIHKQFINRLLKPWAHIDTLVTATEWDNFFALRLDDAAQPEMQALARAMRDALAASVPKSVCYEAYHLPYTRKDDPPLYARALCVARCARVSYSLFAKRNIEADLALAARLRAQKHFSPFEHIATPAQGTEWYTNFRGWVSLRYELFGKE